MGIRTNCLPTLGRCDRDQGSDQAIAAHSPVIVHGLDVLLGLRACALSLEQKIDLVSAGVDNVDTDVFPGVGSCSVDGTAIAFVLVVSDDQRSDSQVVSAFLILDVFYGYLFM